MLAFVIAALPASGAAYNTRNQSPVAASVNLPFPKHACGELLAAASRRYHVDRFPKDSETIGKLYSSAINLNANRRSDKSPKDSFDDFSLQQLIQSYSDLMGCFVSHQGAAPGLTSSPSPKPSRIR